MLRHFHPQDTMFSSHHTVGFLMQKTMWAKCFVLCFTQGLTQVMSQGQYLPHFLFAVKSCEPNFKLALSFSVRG